MVENMPFRFAITDVIPLFEAYAQRATGMTVRLYDGFYGDREEAPADRLLIERQQPEPPEFG